MSENQETVHRHFLYHIFRMDKDENPMPKKHAEHMLQFLNCVIRDTETNGKKEKERWNGK